MSETRKAPRARALNTGIPPSKAITKIEEPKVPVVETMLIPAALLLAAESIAAKAQPGAEALRTVMVQAKDAGTGRVVGYDGVRLFIGGYNVPGKAPSWLKAGLLLPQEDLRARVAMIAKGAAQVMLSHAKGQPVTFLSDPDKTMVFQLKTGPVTAYPAYEELLHVKSYEDLTEADTVQRQDWQPVGFNSRHLKHCGALATILEAGMPKDAREKNGMVVRVVNAGDGEPRMFDFVGYPGAVLVIAAMRLSGSLAQLPAPTARLLAPALKGSLAALRAHVTRNVAWAAEAPDEATKVRFLAAAEGFKRRIEALLGQVPELPALAGPAEAKPKLVGSDKPDAGNGAASKDGPLSPADKAVITRRRRQAERQAAAAVAAQAETKGADRPKDQTEPVAAVADETVH